MKMEIQIAICDDEDKICLQLKDILGSISDEKSVEFIIQIFQCGEDLCKSLKDKDYDLIFLDIELPKINGIEVGKYIREKLNNEIVQIAYISAKTEYAMELFDYRPIMGYRSAVLYPVWRIQPVQGRAPERWHLQGHQPQQLCQWF